MVRGIHYDKDSKISCIEDDVKRLVEENPKFCVTSIAVRKFFVDGHIKVEFLLLPTEMVSLKKRGVDTTVLFLFSDEG